MTWMCLTWFLLHQGASTRLTSTDLCEVHRTTSAEGRNELAKLQGTWIVVSANVFRFDDHDGPEGSKFIFDHDRVTITRHGQRYRINIDPTRAPKQMDMIRSVDDMGRKEAELCVYDLVQDRLTICFGGCATLDPSGGRSILRSRPAALTYVPPQNWIYVLNRCERN